MRINLLVLSLATILNIGGCEKGGASDPVSPDIREKSIVDPDLSPTPGDVDPDWKYLYVFFTGDHEGYSGTIEYTGKTKGRTGTRSLSWSFGRVEMINDYFLLAVCPIGQAGLARDYEADFLVSYGSYTESESCDVEGLKGDVFHEVLVDLAESTLLQGNPCAKEFDVTVFDTDSSIYWTDFTELSTADAMTVFGFTSTTKCRLWVKPR